MTDQNMAQSHCCNHYPNRVLQKRDLAIELGVCEKTVDNLLRAGKLPKPCWLNSIPVWMLYDIHAFLSAQAGKPRTGDAHAETPAKSTASKSKQAAKRTTHRAGKYSA
ncbi:hypothetical protein GCM10009844_00440 [Nocardioides koreensis]|uniref:DNA-binding protein n=1 Tax=Nocardioides koreensis TaxID=433651 RepID=A0ABP5KNY5_9ACTN